MVVLCDGKAASIPVASLEAGDDNEQHREFVADELRAHEHASFATIHVLLSSQWLTKLAETA